MITRIPLSYPSNAVAAGRADDHRPVSRRRFATFLPALLVAGLAIGVSPATLSAPPGPSKDHVWAGCVLTTGAVKALEKSLKGPEGKGVPSPIAFVVVYATLQNDGQRFGDGTTGPSVCINGDTVGIAQTFENTRIPASGKVDIKASERASIMTYQPAPGIFNKRICHTVAGNTDCFLIKPVPTRVPDSRKNGRRPRDDSNE